MLRLRLLGAAPAVAPRMDALRRSFVRVCVSLSMRYAVPLTATRLAVLILIQIAEKVHSVL